ncbi:MAG TPA: translation initiation factor IF-3 [Candidatus Paceibacterota bacterium]|nr:translation initiation factor IF-3 [Candidatus Paceibacterota bacterium]
MKDRIRINHHIRAAQLRVVDEEEGNLGVLSLSEALARAEERGLDLIEISPQAVPPVAKIMDYGKWQYQQNKKEKVAKAGSKNTETKSLQVKIGTGDHDLELKAAKASEFIKEGHRVKIELFLPGRAKYLDPKFLETRLERMLHLISEDYRVAEAPKRGPKGLALVIERAKTASKEKPANQPNDHENQ